MALTKHAYASRWAALLTLAVTASVWAQVAPVQQGHVLDVNPMVGSGGSNTPVQGYVPVNGNDIITGNVTGLGYFHDRVGYSSPYSFQSNLPSTRINAFTRASTGGYSPPQNLGQMRTFYMPSTLVSTDAGRVSAAQAMAGSSNPIESTLTGGGSINPTSAAAARAGAESQVRSMPLNVVPMQDFNNLNARSMAPGIGDADTSPLFGLQRSLLATQVYGTANDETGNDNRANNSRTSAGTPGQRTNDKANNNNTLDQQEEGETPAAGPKDWGTRSQLNDQIKDKPLTARLTTPALTQNPGEIPDTMGKFEPIRVSVPFEETLAALQYNPTNPAQRPTQLNQEEASPDTTRFENATGKSPREGDTRTSRTRGRGGRDTGRTRSAGETVERRREVPEETTPEVKAPVTNPEIKPLIRPAADYIAQAESQFKDGKYLQAADTYQSALRIDPNNTAALLGRAQAELAGGMYESAAFDLKYLFAFDAKQMTVKHNLQELLPNKRLDFLESDLIGLDQKKERTSAGFLLSYIYYQTGRVDELKATLESWAKRAPKDPWPGTLRSAWLGATPEKGAGTQGGG